MDNNNKLIAEFMGGKPCDRCASCGMYIFEDGERLASMLKYDKDWTLLMRVVEHIEKGNYGFKICRKVVEIYFDDTKAVILKTKYASKQESLYMAVVNFIHWQKENALGGIVKPDKKISMAENTDDKPTQTFGQKAVGISFNPSADSAVDRAKQTLANAIDQAHELRSREDASPEQKRLASIAITELQGGQMWLVKALTWKD